MRPRRLICLITILAFLAFVVLVYAPHLQAGPSRAALSISSDCTDARTASVTVILDKAGVATVDISLADKDGKNSAGTCKELRVEFPGKTTGGQIFPGDTFQISPAPQILLKPVDAGSRLTRTPGMADGETLSVNLEGTPPVPPIIHFHWSDAILKANFVTDEVSVPLAPISVHGSPLAPIQHVTLQMVVPNEFEGSSLNPSPAEILPLRDSRANKYDFPAGVSVVTLRWTDAVRNLIKEAGVIVLSLLAGAAISDLFTAPAPATPNRTPAQVVTKPPSAKSRKRRP